MGDQQGKAQETEVSLSLPGMQTAHPLAPKHQPRIIAPDHRHHPFSELSHLPKLKANTHETMLPHSTLPQGEGVLLSECFLSLWICLLPALQTSGITRYLPFCAQLLSRSARCQNVPPWGG